ncbi:glycoside hydrolase family 27 protein [Actinoplanes sp. NPDC051343]|jgi:alpha-galactosidase|uniref:glycoside hydrolase family 27 protein n=1 Tax=Actinoplanes sp. NPDC051343 TaxID=3363906 RepID=UPI0037959839
MRSVRHVLAAASLVAATVLIPAAPAAALGNGLALTPPMGWNDWNTFGCNVNAQLVEQTADTIAAAGLQAAGYQYVNIDDCWMSSSRSSSGHLVPDPAKFPGGITAVANYVHGKGLKLGIYESAGTATCAGYPGSLNHETTDAADFAAWGVDYLKYDNCNNQGVDWKVRYNAMRDALAATGRPIVYSLCEWGQDSVWTWGAGTGNLWRTTDDIQANYNSMLSIYHQNVGLYPYASKGAWNDPDMLEIGNGMSYQEDRSEFTLWSAMAAPLLIGADLRNATPQTLGIYRNAGVIGVDQDSAGVQGRPVTTTGGLDVLAKPLAGGDVAVTLFNENAGRATISTSASAVGMAASSQYKLTNLWSNVVTTTTGSISASVPGHGVVAYRVSPGSGTSIGVARQLVSSVANRCLDVYNNETANGTAVENWDCNTGANQKWTPTAAGELRAYNGTVCLDANGSASGSKVTIWTCNGGTNQQWRLNPDGTITGVQSGLCLDIIGGNNDAGRANGALAELFTCNGGSNQDWQLR